LVEVPAEVAWCAADPHFAPGDGEIPLFLRWVEAFLESEADHLVLLGDLFQVWVGDGRTLSPDQRAVLDAVSGAARRGRTVVYLAGNRDYFMEAEARRRGILAPEHWDLQAGVLRLRFEHGDLINTSDRPYLGWREVSRSGAVRALVGSLPVPWSAALARALERRLSGTNQSYKAYEPGRELQTWAEGLAGEGIGGAVLGHFHRDAEEEVAGVRVRFVPQFREEGLHLRVDGRGTFRLVPFP
jgi:UDP-2,3-diacylglucosamine hydrolase